MTTPADIALVIADLESGGAQRVLVRAAHALRARGWRVAVITLAGPSGDFFRLPDGVDRIAIGGVAASSNLFVGILRNLRRVRALRRALVQSRARTALSFVTQTNVLLLLAGRGLGIRLVVSERNDPTLQALPGVWRRLRDWLYPRADAVTANSEGAAESLARLIPGIAPELLPNPLPPAADPVDAAKPPRAILNVGRLHRQKGQDTLLAAFASLAAEFPALRLILAGEGGERGALLALAERLGVAARVEMPGAVADIDALYRNGCIFALPSRHEGSPNALIEAMSHGLACVACGASLGVRELMTDGIEGMLVPVDDAPALAFALRSLLLSPDLRARLGAAAHAALRARESGSPISVWERVLGLGAPA
jgi:glycosyltransferase involved in cell wall biosynthesis